MNRTLFFGKRSYLFKGPVLKRTTQCMRLKRTRERHSLLRELAIKAEAARTELGTQGNVRKNLAAASTVIPDTTKEVQNVNGDVVGVNATVSDVGNVREGSVTAVDAQPTCPTSSASQGDFEDVDLHEVCVKALEDGGGMQSEGPLCQEEEATTEYSSGNCPTNAEESHMCADVIRMGKNTEDPPGNSPTNLEGSDMCADEVSTEPTGNVYYTRTSEGDLGGEGGRVPQEEAFEGDAFHWSRYQKATVSTPVCECSDVTVGDSIFMVLTLGFRHNLTWDAQVDILKLISSVTACKNIPCSKTAYFNYIDKLKHAMAYQVFCPDCDVYIGEKKVQSKVTGNRKIPEEKFVCGHCAIVVDSAKPANYFVSVSIEEQLKTILADEDYAEDLLTHRFHRGRSDDVLSDIYDGAQYKKHAMPGGILSSKYNFSWTFFTDGISTGKSTGKTMWPIYLCLNEARKEIRHKYIVLAGLYVGNRDPNPWVIFTPFVTEVNKLATEGFRWLHDGKEVVSRIIPLLAITDSVARYQILNMQSYFAYYGCTFCYQKQVTTAPRKRRFDTLCEIAPLRTAETTQTDCLRAYENSILPNPAEKTFRGVKGPSVVMKLKYFDVIWGFVVDPMHAVFWGLAKTHTEYMFESTRSKFWENKNTGVQERMRQIDERLLTITPPSGITRNTRSISMHKLWKASEWRSWLLFYCIPCLQGFLKHKHLVHLALLSKGTCLLLQDSISVRDIAESRDLLQLYAEKFQKYFLVQHTVYNIHLLRHVPTCVENFGPAWTHDAFPYEGQNRHVLQMLTDHMCVLYQVCRRVLIYTSLPKLCHDLVTCDRAAEYAQSLTDKNLHRYARAGQCVLNQKQQGDIPPDVYSLVQECLQLSPETPLNLTMYMKCIFRKLRLTVADYVGGKLKNDSFVFLSGSRYAMRIKYIIAVAQTELNEPRTVLVGEKVTLCKEPILESSYVTLKHVLKMKKLGSLLCVLASSISCQGIFMRVSTGSYLGKMVYGCYGD